MEFAARSAAVTVPSVILALVTAFDAILLDVTAFDPNLPLLTALLAMSALPTHPVHCTSVAITAAIACWTGGVRNEPAAKAATRNNAYFTLIMLVS